MSIRNIIDSRLVVSVNLPAAGASINTDSLNLGTGPDLERLEVRLTIPATPDLEDDKTVTVTFEDSADGADFAAIAELGTCVVTGAGGDGAAAKTREVRLPSSFRGHLRAAVAVQAAGGDNSDVSIELAIVQ